MGLRSGPASALSRRNAVRLGTVIAIAGVLGGALWIVRWGVGDGSTGDVLLYAGAVLVTVLAVGVGSLMVRPIPLKAVVGPCVGLLAWSLAAVVGLDGDPVRAGIVGLVLLVVVPVTWERTRPLQKKPAKAPKEKKPAPKHGARAR